jgi:hypothetical protein
VTRESVEHALGMLRTLIDARVTEILSVPHSLELLLFLVDPAGRILLRALEGPLETLGDLTQVIQQVEAKAALYVLLMSPAVDSRAVTIGLCHPETDTCMSWVSILEHTGDVITLAHESYDDSDIMQWLDKELALDPPARCAL